MHTVSAELRSSKLMARALSSCRCSMRSSRHRPMISRMTMATAATAANPAMPKATQPSHGVSAKKPCTSCTIDKPAHIVNKANKALTNNPSQRKRRGSCTVAVCGSVTKSVCSSSGSNTSVGAAARVLDLVGFAGASPASGKTKAWGVRDLSVIAGGLPAEIPQPCRGGYAGRCRLSTVVGGTSRI